MPVNWTELAVFVCPFVPYGHLVILQILYIGISRNEPEEFVDNGLQMHLLGGKERKTLLEIEAHLITEDALGTYTCTVCLDGTVFSYMAEKVKVLLHLLNGSE